MPRPCTVCKHPRRVDVDKALLDGTPLLRLEKLYRLSRSALRRHRDDHLAKSIAIAAAAVSTLNGEVLTPPIHIGDNLVEHLRDLQRKASEWHAKAEATGDLRGGIAALHELARLAEIKLRAAQAAGADAFGGSGEGAPSHVVILPSNGREYQRAIGEDPTAGEC